MHLAERERSWRDGGVGVNSGHKEAKLNSKQIIVSLVDAIGYPKRPQEEKSEN